MDIYLKLHSSELLTEEKISINIEAVVLKDNHTTDSHPVSISMNGKTHKLALMESGRLRAELMFPFKPEKLQHLQADVGKTETPLASCTLEIIPPGCNFTRRRTQELSKDDILRGEIAVGRGESVTLLKGFYDVAGDIHIKRGAKLIIHAGCTLEFAQSAGIICEGTLEAIGTTEEKITFTASDAHWRNILIYGRHTAGIRMQHCLIEHASGRHLERDQKLDIFIPHCPVGEDSDATHHGGALQFLYTQKAEMTFHHLTIRDNIAKNGFGGAVYLFDSSPVIADSEIMLNESGAGGGGLYIGGAVSSDALLKNLYIRKNKTAQDGGGVYLDHVTPRFEKTSITENESRFGGAIYHVGLEAEEIHLDNCEIKENISHAMPDDDDGFAGD